MNNSFTKFALMLLLILAMAVPQSLFSGVDEDEMTEKLPLMLGQNNLGKDFWFSIPPVYERESGGNINFVKVLIAAPETGAEVLLEIEGPGFEKRVKTIKNTVVEIQVPPAIASAIVHDGSQQKPPPGQVYKGAGIHLSSEIPIVVYVICKYKYTTDGFLALPTNAYGTKYINMVYKEPDITSGLMAPFTAVTAPYDNTQIKFTMGGGDEGTDAVPLEGGRLIRTGETASEVLMRGDVWLLSIDDHRQDLSGSLFEANKPFSIVSGVHCANFPLGVYACDYTVEMELPTHTWGNTVYVTPMADRKFNGIVRIFASEDNTEVKRNGSYLGTIRKGGGAERGVAYLEKRVWGQYDDFGNARPPRIADFTADKPIQIMYYNTGVSEDAPNSPNSDPFMMLMSPIEQFNTEMYFASPNAVGIAQLDFSENFINLIYTLDDGVMPSDLLFAIMPRGGGEPDWKPVNQVFSPGFEAFVTPYKGKTYATTTLRLPGEGVFGIKSDSTKFVAYSYGYGTYESYGYPTAASLRDLTSPDTNAPVPTYVQTCDGDVLKDFGLVTDMPDDDDVRSNIADLYLIDNLNDNYDFQWRTQSGEFIPGQQRTLSWWLTVIDKKQAASATIFFVDRAGNDTTITVSYNPPEYEVVDGHEFGTMAASDAPVIAKDTIRNLSSETPLYVTRVELQDGNQGFRIAGYEPNTWSPGMPIAELSEVIVNIEFDPAAAAASGDKAEYLDSLGVGYGDEEFEECGFAFETQHNAFLGAPEIAVTDWDFGAININETVESTRIMTITNNGDEDLRITGISQDLPAGSPFGHNFMDEYPDVSADTPLIITPGGTSEFQVSFLPNAVGAFTENIVFENNTANNGTFTDNVCVLEGEGTNAVVSADGYIWDGVLINRATFPAGPYNVPAGHPHDGFIVTNRSTTGDIAQVVEVEIVSETPNAREYFIAAGSGENIADYLENNIEARNIAADESEEETIIFNPTVQGLHRIEFLLKFNDDAGNAEIPVVYEGIGLVPNVEVNDISFNAMLVDDEANAQTDGIMTITNTADEFGYPLDVTDISFDNAIVSTDIADFQGETFRYDDAMYQDLINGTLTLAPGAEIQIPVHFVARQVGNNTVNAVIESNANVDGDSYDNDSEWIGIGTDVAINISSDPIILCLNESTQIEVTIENPGLNNPVNLDEIALAQTDLNNDGTDDLAIIPPTTNLSIPPGEEITVYVRYAPSGLITRQFVELQITHQYGNTLGINGAEEAVEVESEFYSGNTTTNLNGADEDNNPTKPEYDTEFTVSIGDEFDYEINLTGDVVGSEVPSVRVNVNYNRLFVQPTPDGDPYNEITVGIPNARIQPGSIRMQDAVAGPKGSMFMTFILESEVNNSIFTSEGNVVSIPFLTVLPAVQEEGELSDVTNDAGNSNYGRFDMSHSLTELPACYAHISDMALVAIREICVGDFRALYISDLGFTEPIVAPNPASSDATIEYTVPYDQPGVITMYNANMQKVGTLYDGEMKEGVRTTEIPVSELSNGTYYFKIVIGEKQQLGRMVIKK